MDVKYALVDFFTDNTVHICEISELKHPDVSKLKPEALHLWDKREEVYILWKKSPSVESERWPCRVIQFSADRQPLIETRRKSEKGSGDITHIPLFAPKEDLGKGKREKSKRPVTELAVTSLTEDFPVIAKKQRLNKNVIHQNIMAAVKQSCSENTALRSADNNLLKEVEKLKMEIQDLKYERRFRIKAEKELREWKEMHSVVQELRVHDTSASQQLGDSTTQGCGLEMNFICLRQDVNIKKTLYNQINSRDYKKFTCELLLVIFGRETLATHSLNGRKAANAVSETIKEALPANKVSILIDHVQQKFNVSASEIKAVIHTKLNNEDKLWKKRLCIAPVFS
ncbi:hypothetical protein AOLI_G00099770 [Acnodon oligacanthus]